MIENFQIDMIFTPTPLKLWLTLVNKSYNGQFLYERHLQRIMVAVFIMILDWIFVLMNATTVP